MSNVITAIRHLLDLKEDTTKPLKRVGNNFVPMDVKAGDRILYGKYSGTEIKIDLRLKLVDLAVADDFSNHRSSGNDNMVQISFMFHHDLGMAQNSWAELAGKILHLWMALSQLP